MGDFNAKIGIGNIGRQHVMGREGLGQVSKNGTLFADFCSLNNTVIGGNLFVTSGFIKPLGFSQIISQRTTLIILLYVKGSEDPYKTRV